MGQKAFKILMSSKGILKFEIYLIQIRFVIWEEGIICREPRIAIDSDLKLDAILEIEGKKISVQIKTHGAVLTYQWIYLFLKF